MCAARLGVSKPFHSLTVTMFRLAMKSKPKLKLKAAEARHFLPIMKEIIRTCLPADSAHQVLRLQCVDSLLCCYQEMEHWDQRSSPERFATAGKRHLLLLVHLRGESEDPLRWALYPKHHLLIHLIEGAVVNPRLEWNYRDESEIGDAVAMSHNTSSRHVCTALVGRYRNTFKLED